jgi:hypothetical protein
MQRIYKSDVAEHFKILEKFILFPFVTIEQAEKSFKIISLYVQQLEEDGTKYSQNIFGKS